MACGLEQSDPKRVAHHQLFIDHPRKNADWVNNAPPLPPAMIVSGALTTAYLGNKAA